MRPQFFHVEHFQAVRLHDLDRAEQREVRKVLVVDRVKLVELDQLQQMGKFERQHPFGLQNHLEPFDKIIQIRNLCQHVVTKHEVGAAAFGGEFLSQLRSEEAYQGGDALFDSYLGNIRRRLNPQHRHIALDEILQQIAVIAGHFHHEAVAA